MNKYVRKWDEERHSRLTGTRGASPSVLDLILLGTRLGGRTYINSLGNGKINEGLNNR
jgi:hypothetical protein